MIQIDVRAITLFFFYATLDEKRAIEAASEAFEQARKKVSKNPQLKSEVVLVSVTKQVWENNSGRFLRGRPNYSSESGWLLPDKLDLGAWKEFQKVSQEDEFLCLIWSKILKISDEDISLGLGVSVGTLRYRIGRALRKLGALSNPVSTKPSLAGVPRP